MESSYYYYHYCYWKAQALLELFSGVLCFVDDPFVFLFGWLDWVLGLLSEFCGDAVVVVVVLFCFLMFCCCWVVIFCCCFSCRIYIHSGNGIRIHKPTRLLTIPVQYCTDFPGHRIPVRLHPLRQRYPYPQPYPFVDHACATLNLFFQTSDNCSLM